jgi:hypothetical protein
MNIILEINLWGGYKLIQKLILVGSNNENNQKVLTAAEYRDQT